MRLDISGWEALAGSRYSMMEDRKDLAMKKQRNSSHTLSRLR